MKVFCTAPATRCCFCIAASLLVFTSPMTSPLALLYYVSTVNPLVSARINCSMALGIVGTPVEWSVVRTSVSEPHWSSASRTTRRFAVMHDGCGGMEDMQHMHMVFVLFFRDRRTQFANCEPTGLGEGTSCGEVLKVAVGTARTSAPVWALAVSSPPSRAAASASPPAFLSSQVP